MALLWTESVHFFVQQRCRFSVFVETLPSSFNSALLMNCTISKLSLRCLEGKECIVNVIFLQETSYYGGHANYKKQIYETFKACLQDPSVISQVKDYDGMAVLRKKVGNSRG